MRTMLDRFAREMPADLAGSTCRATVVNDKVDDAEEPSDPETSTSASPIPEIVPMLRRVSSGIKSRFTVNLFGP
jgi:hypothetical protein